MSWKSKTLILYACVSIYGRYKENLQQESFCKSIPHRSVNHLVLAVRLFAAPPFHFIKSKTDRVDWSSVSQPMPSSASFYVFNLSLNIQSLFLYIYSSLLFFLFSHPWKKSFFYSPAPFVWPDSRVIVGCVRNGMRRGLVLVGVARAYLPTVILPATSLFLPHCDSPAKEKRYTCCSAARRSAVFVINMELCFSQVLLLFSLVLPVCLGTSGCAA